MPRKHREKQNMIGLEKNKQNNTKQNKAKESEDVIFKQHLKTKQGNKVKDIPC